MRQTLGRWLDSAGSPEQAGEIADESIDWLRIVPFIALHVACIAVLWVGTSPIAILVAGVSYVLRMFAITAFFHRYFSHKAFETGRITQFAFALLGTTATQRGPLWWAAHHRKHHHYADTDEDPHPSARGFLWSHIGWFLSKSNFATDEDRVKDLARYPELQWLNRFDVSAPLLYALCLYLLGEWLKGSYPETSGWQLVVWGYFISTVVLTHATLLINSLAHRVGRRRFQTRDESKNSLWLALLTLGEGWHNNHHRYAGAARQGFYWWEIDISYYGLRLLEKLGLVWNLKTVPAKIIEEGRP